MKNRILFCLSAAVLCFAGCVKENSGTPSESGSVNATIQTAEYPIVWGEGESIARLYEKYEGVLGCDNIKLDSGAGTAQAGFGSDSSPVTPVVSLYPASLVEIIRLSSAAQGTVPIIWPSVQKYSGSALCCCPMYSLDKGADAPVCFKSIGGVLSINAKGNVKVKSVSVKSADFIAGKCDFTISTAQTAFRTGAREITLDCGEGVGLDNSGTDFSISLPCGVFSGVSVAFTLDFEGKDVVVARTIDGDVAIAPGKKVSESFEVSLDGAVVMAGRKTVTDNVRIVQTTVNDLGSKLKNEPAGHLDISEEDIPTMSLFISSILSGNIPAGYYTTVVLNYLTKDPTGAYVVASGVMAWPQCVEDGGKYDRIVSVQHGTCDIDQAPSLFDFSLELAPVFHRQSRNVVVMADYLGYGASRTPNLEHPYMHAGLTGSACADMLLASENYLASYAGFRYADEVSDRKPIGICGYSQGGQASLATLFVLQDRGYTDRIDDVRVGAGPVDLVSMFDVFTRLDNYFFMGYVPYTLRGMIYGDQLEVDLHNVYSAGVFDSGMDAKFNTTMLSTWHSPLGTDVREVLHPDFFSQERNADIQKLFEAAERNSIINFGAPANPSVVTLFHEVNDDEVPYLCSVNASRLWGCKLEDLTFVDDFHLLGAVEFYFRYLGDDIWDSVKEDLTPLLQFLSE